ncbi:CapA family protein [Arthrobacter rhombi]|uniref:CapA family protein n=1 Tax=Arthrobacter rhombi TaxID=71253 RepID=UPI003FCFA719
MTPTSWPTRHRALGRLVPLMACLLLISGCSAADSSNPAGGGATPGGSSAQTMGPSQTQTPTKEPASTVPSPTPSSAEEVSVMVTGDVLLHPPLWEQARADGSSAEPDFVPLLSGLRPYLADADLAICSLETPVGTEQGPYSGYPSFVVPPQILPALAATGYDACTTATNHAVDGGTAGLKRTLDALDRAGLEHTGTYRSAAEAKQPLILETGGIRVGIVVGTYGLNGLSADTPWRVDLIDTEKMIAQAKKARRAGADVVLAGFHAGEEYSTRPTAEQQGIAHRLADSGAFDAVYSHHTHSVLPLEKRGGVWIAYGLGNSVSSHATDLAVNREGLSLKFSFVKKGDHWKTAAPRWAGHIMAQDPVRWCALPAKTPCTTAAEDAASLKRTRSTVNSLGADADGAGPWQPDDTK